MFEGFRSEKKIVIELYALFRSKSRNLDNKKTLLKELRLQLGLIKFIDRKSTKTDNLLLRHLIAHLSNPRAVAVLSKLKVINSAQENILIESLKQDLEKIKEMLRALQVIIVEQVQTLEGNKSGNLNELLSSEKTLLFALRRIISGETELQKKISENLKLVKEMEHKDWVIKLMKSSSKLAISKKFNVVITGQENIPAYGPVVLAPRHFHGDYDPFLFYNITHRRVFFLAATDWLKEGVQIKVRTYLFRKAGAVPINRPDSMFEKPTKYLKAAFKSIVRLLMLGQAVVIFPEGWPNIDSHGTRKEPGQEFIEVKAGLFHFVDYAQKKRRIRIPMIPIGVKYGKEKKGIKPEIVVNIGKPFYLPISGKRIDFNPFLEILQKEIERLSK